MGTLHDLAAGRIEQPDSPPEFRSLFADSYAGRVNDHAKWILKDMTDPLSSGDSLDELIDQLIDDTSELREFVVRVLKGTTDGEYEAFIRRKARDYAYGEARREAGDE